MRWRSELQSILLLGLLSAAVGSVAWAAGEVVSTSDAVWTTEGNQMNAKLGESLAAVGDVNGDNFDDFIVGSRFYDSGNTDSGIAWLFYGSDTGPTTTPNVIFNPPFVEFAGFFGWTVAGAGDVNGDDYDDVMISMPNYNGGQSDEGAVFVYYGSQTGIDTTPDWRVESDLTFAHLGWGAGSAGDVNNDGYDDIIVGAYRYDNSPSTIHHAYVFHGSDTGLDTGSRPVGRPGNADWTALGDQTQDAFGTHVGTAGDVNGDNYDDVFIAAPRYNGSGYVDEGRVFVYHGSQTGLDKDGTRPSGSPSNFDWATEVNQANAYLSGPDAISGVGFTGDVNCDGYDDLLIGSSYYDHDQDGEGMAFLWLGSMNGLNSGAPAWTVESNEVNGQLGTQVGWAGDVNGDGCDDFMVGHRLYDVTGSNDVGRTAIYFGNDTSFTAGENPEYADALIVGDQASCYSGETVSAAGDVDGDGYDDFIVGAINYNGGLAAEGKVFGFRGGPVVFFGNFETGNRLRWTSTQP